MHYFDYGYMGWGGWVFMVLWWVLIIIGLVALVRWIVYPSRGGAPQTKSPLDILKERYAKGEMNKKEFEEKRKDLV